MLFRSRELQIKTHYESLDIAKSNTVHYLRFKINKELPIDLDDELAKRTREIESTQDARETEEEKKTD